MRKFLLSILTFSCLFFLTACTNQLTEIKKAILDIDSTANKAANAISMDAHTVRAIEIEYKDESFTINDLFESILRDVQWEYENFNELQKLKVRGTWKENLFDSEQFTEEQKSKLLTDGKVTVAFQVNDHQIYSDSVEVKLSLNDKLLVHETGKKALESLYNSYLSTR